MISAGPAHSPVLESDSRATTPAPTRPRAPRIASTPPVGSSSSDDEQGDGDQRDQDKWVHAADYPLSQSPASAQRSMSASQFVLVGVLTLFEKDELTLAVVEGGVGKAAKASRGSL